MPIYAQLLANITAQLKQLAPKAKLYWVIAGDVGLPATNRFTGEPVRDRTLNPHLDRHSERLA
eukprot:COSAG03_NODE_10163_length_668_cov_0.803163_2_plen_62_part_01